MPDISKSVNGDEVASTLDEPLRALVDRIVEEAHPIQIILFGSRARGTVSSKSDIDLLIIMPEGTHRRETARRLYRSLTGIGTSFDLVVATEQDLKVHRDNPGLIYATALKEGRVVYAG
jgi:predicted nucleotidyltransferase